MMMITRLPSTRIKLREVAGVSVSGMVVPSRTERSPSGSSRSRVSWGSHPRDRRVHHLRIWLPAAQERSGSHHLAWRRGRIIRSAGTGASSYDNILIRRVLRRGHRGAVAFGHTIDAGTALDVETKAPTARRARANSHAVYQRIARLQGFFRSRLTRRRCRRCDVRLHSAGTTHRRRSFLPLAWCLRAIGKTAFKPFLGWTKGKLG